MAYTSGLGGAASAYGNANQLKEKLPTRQGYEKSILEDGKTVSKGPSFTSYLEGAFQNVQDVTHRSERMSIAAAAGKANLSDVVQAVNDASITLQTVTAVRDKVIQSYQQIARMPL